ncbi:hypothetical protein E2C01_016899 [Portunus trituberculatus]|uniref:Uncharacterized protein n=1 Tax=Portunus trituberculatus TaxID=210409 RepID=A0A5B7DS51_PORTR|nr:hypothetical protein [Portunus trituberculatus]
MISRGPFLVTPPPHSDRAAKQCARLPVREKSSPTSQPEPPAARTLITPRRDSIIQAFATLTVAQKEGN